MIKDMKRTEKKTGCGMRFVRAGSAALFSLSLIAVYLLLMFAFPGTAFDRKRPEYATLVPMAAAGIAAGLLLAALVRHIPHREIRPALRRLALPAGCVCLFAVQAVICFHGYFLMGWDSISTMKSAYAIAGGDELIDNYYLSLYPNNALLTLLFGGVMKLFRMISPGARLDRCVFILILVQCAVSSLTCFVITRTAQKVLRSGRAAACVFAVYAGFTGISPWLMVPYSDSMGLIMPALILCLYVSRARLKWAFWPALGLLTWLGYACKPQCCIVSVAIVLLEGARLAMSGRAVRALAGALCVIAMTAVGAGPVTDAILDASPIEMREGRDIGGLLHYVMMGLNPESNGVYRDADMQVSAWAETPQARRDAQMAVIRERVSAMDAGDWAAHLTKKALSNFSDAPVMWSLGGACIWQTIEDKDGVLSPLIKGLLGLDGTNVTATPLTVYFECVWLAMLAFAIFAPLKLRGMDEAGASALCVMMLSVFGLMLFQMIFEAGNRYFMVYTPFMAVLAVCGLGELTARAETAICAAKERRADAQAD